MQNRLFISFAVGVIISSLTLYLAFRNVPMADLTAYLGAVNYWWIFPTVGIIIVTFILRVVRWRIILKDICAITFRQAFHPTMIGFMMNCVLPGRVGELARPALLKRHQGVALTTGLATVAAERIFDLFILIALFALTFSAITARPDLQGDYFGIELNAGVLRTAATGMIRLSIALLLCIALLSIGTTRRMIKQAVATAGRWMDRIVPRFHRFNQRSVDFLLNIIDNISIGLSLVRNPAQLLSCMGLTLLIWALTALAYLVFAFGCPGIRLSLTEWTTVMVIVCFVIALPSVPGFWGVWEAGGVFALSIFGVAEKDALGFTLVNHAAQVFPVIGIGLVSALITSVNIIQLSQTHRPADPQSAA